jgi:putative methyltransferase (TIGR04325 family)
LRVLDFGGSLGWSYYRVRNVLPDSQALAWDVVETPAMVEAAREECAEADLHFFTDLAQVQGRTYDVVLASGSLQYIDSPSSCFDRLCAVAAPFMILDLLPFSDAERDRLAVQSPPGEDRFLYPAWVFSHSLWTARFAAAGWRVRLRWPHRDACLFLDGKRHEYQGLLLERPPARDRT